MVLGPGTCTGAACSSSDRGSLLVLVVSVVHQTHVPAGAMTANSNQQDSELVYHMSKPWHTVLSGCQTLPTIVRTLNLRHRSQRLYMLHCALWMQHTVGAMILGGWLCRLLPQPLTGGTIVGVWPLPDAFVPSADGPPLAPGAASLLIRLRYMQPAHMVPAGLLCRCLAAAVVCRHAHHWEDARLSLCRAFVRPPGRPLDGHQVLLLSCCLPLTDHPLITLSCAPPSAGAPPRRAPAPFVFPPPAAAAAPPWRAPG
jgi:hypothetical protein